MTPLGGQEGDRDTKCASPGADRRRPVCTVVAIADRRYAPGLKAAVASAVAAASGNCDYDFRIVDAGLAPDTIDNLASTVERIGRNRGVRAIVSTLGIDSARLAALPERRGSRAFYAKLLIPEALPEIDAIVHLDVDVLCFLGIEAVRPPAGEDTFLLAGVRDFFGVIERDCPWLDQVPKAERRLPYINSGVMWMNLRRLREMNFTEKAIAARTAVHKARFADQAVFNFLCRNKIHLLSDAINYRTQIGATGPLCAGDLDLNIHYISPSKPWLGPPSTSTWLAHNLWHQAYRAIFPESDSAGMPDASQAPGDIRSIRIKAALYRLINPRRAEHYRKDLRSVGDPGCILKKAAAYWKAKA
jgi:lipopolysaccharide biosynthesis glycosyltransferase